jgi:hypothetical protein
MLFHRFERELEALRKELAEATSSRSTSSGNVSDLDLASPQQSPELTGLHNFDPKMPSIDLAMSPVTPPGSLDGHTKKDQ